MEQKEKKPLVVGQERRNSVDFSAEGFRAAMRERGLEPPDVIVPGEFHRFPGVGKQPANTAGWCLLFPDYLGGIFGDWAQGWKEVWSAKRGLPLIHRAREAYAQVEAKMQPEVAKLAAEIWQQAKPATNDHPYLIRKSVRAYGLRQHDGRLVVPMYNGAGGLQSLQFIHADGGKRFLKGGLTKNVYFLIGDKPSSDTLCIAEGYATAASIHMATGYPVAVAFTANNLLPVAQTLRAKYPRLILCADDDYRTEGNPGKTKATEAARAVGGLLAIPDFGAERPDGATDFNDLHERAGLLAVAECLKKAAAPPASAPANNEWPAPNPITAELKPVPAFDAETLLPDVLRAWIMDEAERMPCPPEFVATAALVALGALIGARCAIKPKRNDSWLIVPNLWGGIVGYPASKKSPAWSAALKPLDKLIAKAAEEHRTALADYETAKVVYDAQKDAIESRIKEAAKKKGDIDAIARELRSHGEQAPVAPTLRRYKTNDSTVEKLGELLRENPTGLLVLRDELVGLIATWEREGREGERAFFLEAWNGNQSFDTDRIGRGHVSIPNLCLSLFGGIQPDKLTAYLEQAAHSLANDGMLQRFQVLVFPDLCRWEWRDRAPNNSAREAAYAVFERLADFDPIAWGAEPADEHARFPWFRFSNEAQTVFIRWSEELHRDLIPQEESPLIQQHLAKYDKLFPALALIFHLVEGVRGPVTKAAALRAAAWCEFLEAHARRCYGLLMDDGLRSAQALADKLKRGALDDGFTVRDVRRNRWRNLTTDEAIQAALDWLEDEYWLRGELCGGTGPSSGRRTVRYWINPAVKEKVSRGNRDKGMTHFSNGSIGSTELEPF